MKKYFAILLLLAAASIFPAFAGAQVIVIANPSVKPSTVSKSVLRALFTGDSSKLADGSQVAPVLLKQGDSHNEFLLLYIGKNEATFRACWRSQVFSGNMMMPKTFDSEKAVVDYVAHTADAIGYISPKTPHDGVKVLSVM